MLKKMILMLVAGSLLVFVAACNDDDDDDKNNGNGGPVSSKTFVVKYEGPGGHSNGNYGNVNAVHAAARSMVMLVNAQPAGSYVMNNFIGGNSVNSIAFDGTFTVTATGTSGELAYFAAALQKAVDDGVKAENDFRGKAEGETNSSGGRVDVRATIN